MPAGRRLQAVGTGGVGAGRRLQEWDSSVRRLQAAGARRLQEWDSSVCRLPNCESGCASAGPSACVECQSCTEADVGASGCYGSRLTAYARDSDAANANEDDLLAACRPVAEWTLTVDYQVTYRGRDREAQAAA